MRDALVSRQEAVMEDFGRVLTCEVPGLGGGVENLPARVWVDGQVIDALVRGRVAEFGSVWCLG